MGDTYGRNSLTVIIRRKILRNIDCGLFGRVALNGSRGGEVLIYHKDKKHNIIITIERRDFRYYCCEKIIDQEHSKIGLANAEELDNDKWVPLGDIEIFTGNIIKVV
jgi:hypothetical protein